MNILLIDADSTIVNLPLAKISTYYKSEGHKTTLIRLNIPYYPQRRRTIHSIDTKDYDLIFCSVVFDGTIDFINGDNIIFGGTGFDLEITLPDYIEKLRPDYSLYPENNISYGFITRGCVRTCSFCKVPKKEGYIRQVNKIDTIVQHSKVKFLDNNILSFPGHIDILKELIDKNIKHQFNQGLDIRFVNKENSLLLKRLNYLKEYIFAFDSYKYLNLIEDKIKLLSWRRDWQIKFFVYVSPIMPLNETIKRIHWLKNNKCLPYIMRDISCWNTKYSNFYTDIAAYCNQPHCFKKLTFEEFLDRRHKNKKRVFNVYNLYKANL